METLMEELKRVGLENFVFENRQNKRKCLYFFTFSDIMTRFKGKQA